MVVIRRQHDGEKLGRLRDVVEDRPVRWHSSGRVFSPLGSLRLCAEKIRGSVESHGEIQVGLLVELRDIYLDAIRSAWLEFPAAGRASLRARLPEIAGPGEEFAASAARLTAVVDAVLLAHGVSGPSAPSAQSADYISPAERASLAAAFEEEVE